jgi:UDP-glucose 4-epimerase
MSKNNQLQNIYPKRVVILGSKGFIGSHVSKLLKQKNILVLDISRNEIDLSKQSASNKLSQLLNIDDFLLIASANAPVKNNQMLVSNVKMMEIIINAIEKIGLKRVVYLSSDAVYSDIKTPMNEESPTEPYSLHGIMHLTREVMLQNLSSINLSIVRPTLVYGENDPHNGYGPNQFFRLAAAGQNIKLFGAGEENRDHVSVCDVAKIICEILLSDHIGTLNIASGEIVTFKKIAEIISNLYDNKITINETIRVGKMPHNGYRSFNISKLENLFPKIKMTKIEKGLKDYYNKIV